VSGRSLRLRREARQRGDVRHTAADCRRAAEAIGFRPQVELVEGLRREWQWIQEVY